MPDSISSFAALTPQVQDGAPQALTYRQRLEGISSNFERRQAVSQGHALRELKRDLDYLWRIARDEELDLIGVKDV